MVLKQTHGQRNQVRFPSPSVPPCPRGNHAFDKTRRLGPFLLIHQRYPRRQAAQQNLWSSSLNPGDLSYVWSTLMGYNGTNVEPSKQIPRKKALSPEILSWIVLGVGLPSMVAVWFSGNIHPEYPFNISGKTFGWVTYAALLVAIVLTAFVVRNLESNLKRAYRMMVPVFLIIILLRVSDFWVNGDMDWFGVIVPFIVWATMHFAVVNEFQSGAGREKTAESQPGSHIREGG